MILIKTNLENRRKINYLGWIQPGVDRKRIVKGKKERIKKKIYQNHITVCLLTIFLALEFIMPCMGIEIFAFLSVI